MPMLDVYIPEGALAREAEHQLIGRLTDILITWEGADPTDPRTRAASWAFLHHSLVFVGGQPPNNPRYKVVVSVPEGQLDAERRAGMVSAVTEAVLDAEEVAGRRRNPFAVWVIAGEVPERTWGVAGRILGLAEIAETSLGDAEAARAHAKQRLAIARAEREAVFDQ